LYYDNELDKPLDLLINRLRAMLKKSFAETSVLFIPTAAMQDEVKANAIIHNSLLLILTTQTTHVTV